MNTPFLEAELALNPEFAALGSIILHGDRSIPPPDFGSWLSHFAASDIWASIQRVRGGDGSVCAVALKDDLERVGRLAAIGGDEFLLEVMEAACIPSAFGSVCDVLRDRWARSQVAEIVGWLGRVSERDDVSPGDIASELLDTAAVIMGCRHASPVMSIGEIDHEGGDPGVPSGFPEIDSTNSTGGYPSGQMSVISAYHKVGKSTFMLASALVALRRGERVLWATFADLNGKQIKRRMLRALCGWSSPPTRLDLAAAYDEAVAFLRSAPLDVYDASRLDHGFDVETFASWFKLNQARQGYNLVFVDYAQKLHSARRLGAYEEGTYCSQLISRLAAASDVPFVVGSQITKGSAKEATEDITKGSRAWEEDAGLVVRLSRGDDGNRIGLRIPYQRFGPSGIEAELIWDAERLTIESLSEMEAAA